MRRTTLRFGLYVIVALALASGGGAARTGLSLPEGVDENATIHTTDVTLPEASLQGDDVGTAGEGEPAAQAAFGQCVAVAAQAATEHGDGLTPTDDCVNTNAKNGTASANANAADGRSTAETAGANGAANAAEAGVAAALARGGNADSHP